MRFGIITPVFDGCINSLELLYNDLDQQRHKNWVWVLCSNSFSEKMSEFVNKREKPDSNHRIMYTYIDNEDEKNIYCMIANIGERKNFSLKQINADYIFMIDADAKILDRMMFETIGSELEKDPKSMCLFKVIHGKGVLPIFPIKYGRIDLLNFCVKASLAKKVGYPTTVNFHTPGNDFRYFRRIYEACGGDYLFINKIFCQHNGNRSYKNVVYLHDENRKMSES